MSNFLTFSDVYVGPTEEVLRAPSGSLFRGGPLWPEFESQVEARQCRGLEIKPIDDMPTFAPVSEVVVEQGVWCGPVVSHFGHMIADFGMRIALSSRLDPAIPLVFSSNDTSVKPKIQDPPPFFWAIIDHFKIDRKRVLLVNSPVLFRTLYVFPQAERMAGPAPEAGYLDFLDEITHVPEADRLPDINKLYVSRSKFLLGGLAGESYLDSVLGLAGVKVIYPELMSLSAQLHHYQSAKSLIFSEGSAVHALQLIGRLEASVGILVRRSKARIAQHSVRSRARSTKYLEAAPELVHGLRPSGFPNQSKGITLLNGADIVEKFLTLKIDIGSHWNENEFRRQQAADLKAWALLRLDARNVHPGERDAIKESLAKLSNPVVLEEIF